MRAARALSAALGVAALVVSCADLLSFESFATRVSSDAGKDGAIEGPDAGDGGQAAGDANAADAAGDANAADGGRPACDAAGGSGSVDPTYKINGAVKVINPISGLQTLFAPKAIVVYQGTAYLAGQMRGCVSPTSNDDLAVAAFKPDGTADLGFGSAGVLCVEFAAGANEVAATVMIDRPGTGNERLVVAGSSYDASTFSKMVVARCPDLRCTTLDPTFGVSHDGRQSIDDSSTRVAFGAALAPERSDAGTETTSIVLAGGNNFIDRSTAGVLAVLREDGSLDTRWRGTGIGVDGDARAYIGVAYSPVSGSLYAVGKAYRLSPTEGGVYQMLTRAFTRAGALDASFGTGGSVFVSAPGSANDFGRSIAVEGATRTSMRVTMGGGALARSGASASFGSAAVTRFDANGNMDPAFNGGALATLPGLNWSEYYELAPAMSVKGGKTLVAGYLHNAPAETIAVARYGDDGLPDLCFGNSGITAIRNAADAIGVSVYDDPSGILVLASDGSGSAFLYRLRR